MIVINSAHTAIISSEFRLSTEKTKKKKKQKKRIMRKPLTFKGAE